jgi:hypothetical protein
MTVVHLTTRSVRSASWRGDPSEAGMTTTDTRRPMTAPAAPDPDEQAWLRELLDRLPASCLPGTYDDLAAALLRQHAPSHLLWHLSVLPRARRFETTEELLTHLGEASGSATAVPVPT